MTLRIYPHSFAVRKRTIRSGIAERVDWTSFVQRQKTETLSRITTLG